MSTAKVEIYTQMMCGYCTRAKRLLEAKFVDYIEFDVTMGGQHKRAMLARKPDARTVPQIFINEVSIGGCDDLFALDSEGRLDGLLGQSSSA